LHEGCARSSVLAARLLVVALVITACGQKPHVLVDADGMPVQAIEESVGDPGTGGEPGGPLPGGAGGTDAPQDLGDPGVEQPRSQQPGSSTAPPSAPRSGPAPTQTEEPAPTGTRQVRGTDRTGVSDTHITVGAHAPATGAAPLPQGVFEWGTDLYWRYLHEIKGETVLGRQIRVEVRDDRYQPSSALQVCRELMREVFSMTGVGADGIAACGRLAGAQGVPYVSMGADEGDLANNPWYFAMSVTYPQQAELWAQYIKRHFPGQKVGATAIDTSNWNAAVNAWHDALERHGIDYHPTLRHGRDDGTWYESQARALNNAGVTVVFALTSPIHLTNFATKVADNRFPMTLLYISPGGLNTLLNSFCPQMSNTLAFSAWPSIDLIPQLAPEYADAIEKMGIRPNPVDIDLGLALWGVNQMAHAMFTHYQGLYGNDLTREDFRDAIENMTISTGLFPDQTFTPDNHFGTRPGVHVLKANCDRKVFEDGGTFRTGF
jgi:ABC-type branched-subunit amino acid transport system substrate-binding protein